MTWGSQISVAPKSSPLFFVFSGSFSKCSEISGLKMFINLESVNYEKKKPFLNVLWSNCHAICSLIYVFDRILAGNISGQ